MRRFLLGSVLLFFCRSLLAQQDALSVDQLLPKIYDYAERYRAALPSLSCDESIRSEEVRKGVVRKEVRIESTLREVRTGQATFDERHEFRTVDGRPVSGHRSYPYLVQGGFANALGFADRSKTQCYDYEVEGRDGGNARLELRGRPEREGCHDIPEGYRKSVVVDVDSGRVSRVERSISAEAARKGKEVFFASFEYGPQRIGDETMWLPTKMVSHDARDEGRMEATYSNYHRFAGSATVLPATAREPE